MFKLSDAFATDCQRCDDDFLRLLCSVLVSKTIEELSLEWKTMNPVIMGKGLRMPQFEIVKIAASDCQESFQIGECRPQKSYLAVHLLQYY